MKQIIFDCERMKYVNTGLYHYCMSLGKSIEKKSRENNHEEITFFSPPAVQHYLGFQHAHLNQHSLQKFFMPSLKGYDVWHATYQGSHYLPERNKKIKVVLTIHDLNFLHEEKTEAKRAKHLKHLQKNIDRSDAIVCISDFCRKDVLTHTNTGNKPLHVIYNGTNHLAEPALTDQSYKPAGKFLFSLGSVCRKKNFHVLLPLLKQYRDMELLIAGRHDDSHYLHFIRSLARKLKVDENLRLLGNINEHEKSWYYRNCFAFALPSIAEGFGLPVTEAMSVGKPVFLSDKTALPEIGSNLAFYFRDFSASHIQHVFNKGMREYEENKMRQAILQHSENFCWDKAASEYLNVYRSLY
ncbi:glycosyltransferase family 1 protein [Terrimonas sp.]|uniref:glycosyltransferase family 4 protein n=1 Tax=Terrimonas sp. TaxID=1914338 RepID=UPI000D51F9E0|nr:glycosyltransferase family 1 protein [Terrimonas sp.]PVD51473.1 glycosyltransferase family 1 protein [Terrimonas sp.]